MRRAILLLAAMGAAMVLASGVALAVTKQCKTYDAFTNKGICYGTNERDTLRGTDGVNVMYAKFGGDRLYGFGSQDHMHGQGDNDTAHYDNPGIYNGTFDVVTNCETLNP